MSAEIKVIDIDNIHIDEFDFNNRVYDDLVKKGINTLADLKGKTACEIGYSPKSSYVGSEELIVKLGKKGIRIKEEHHNKDQVRAVILGTAIADAMGVPVEFMSREQLAENPVKGYLGYGAHNVPAGTWSDDTSMVLATLDSLSYGVDYADIMKRFSEWKLKAAYTATDEVFDMGVTTNDSICRFMKGIPALECGGKYESDNGNGSLMRIAPAALFCNCMFADTIIDERIEIIHNISSLTHAHLRSQIGCGIFSFILWELLEKQDKESIQNGLWKAENFYKSRKKYIAEISCYERIFKEEFSQLEENDIKSSGYVVDTLEAAVWCLLNTESYSECILKAVNLGRDTDTVAAVAGGLAAALYGIKNIPKDWIKDLKSRGLLLRICDKFISLNNSEPTVLWDDSRIAINLGREKKKVQIKRNETINHFAQTMLYKYQNRNAKERDVHCEMFYYTCFAYGFTTDLQELGNSYRETFGSDDLAKLKARAFSRIAFKIKDVDMLGSVIFAKYRWITHWSSQSLLSEDNRAWFIAAFERLIELTERHPVERTPFNYLVDTHGHYLPGIDDGSSNIEMSVAMIKKAYEQGIRDIVCTSHSWGYTSKYSESFEMLQKRLKDETLDVMLYKGCEVACDERTLPVIIDRIESGELLTVANSKYILLEFKQNVEGIEILRCVKQLIELTDCVPIIAHIERYYNLHEDSHTIEILTNWNIPIQINAYSLVEEKKETIKAFARKLLEEKLVTFVGSDAHRTTHRPVNVQTGVEYIYASCDEEYAKDVCFRNAEKMLFFTDIN